MDQRIEAFPGRYWHVLADGRIQCDVCPRYCKLHDGQRVLCFVRARQGDGIVLTTYGRSSGFCIDPSEKKPLNHFLPGTPVLSFGTAGCNLTCKFCQNWDISKAREFDRLQDRASPEAIAAAAVVLPMPISPRHKRLHSAGTASWPAATAERNSCSVRAGACVKSAVGRSSASA